MSYIAFLSLTFALVITPGATTAVVVRNALAGGRSGGLWAAVGAAIGNSTHALAAGLGLAVLIGRMPSALFALQFAGGIYLAWLGAQSALRVLRGTAVPVAATILSSAQPAHFHHAVREGAVANLLNPAIITFYLTVVPTFVPPGAPPWHYAALATTHIGMAYVVHSAWALALHHMRPVLERPAARTAFEVLTATALLGFAWRVLSALRLG